MIKTSHTPLLLLLSNLAREAYKLSNESLSTNTLGIDNIFSGIEMKYCPDCRTELPLSFFYKLRQYSNGRIDYYTHCKECHKLRCAKRRAERLNDPAYREKHLQQCKENNKKHKAIINGNSRLRQHYLESKKKTRQ